MRNSAFKTAFAILLFTPIMSALPVRAGAPTLTLTEQEVIEVLLAQEIGAKVSKKHVIMEYTSIQMLRPDQGVLELANAYDTFANSLRDQAKDRDKAFKKALDDFLEKNKTSVQIIFPTNAPKSVELVSDATIKGIFSAKRNAKPNGWDVFYRRFPDSGGFYTISRVGIDSRGTVAIIYFGEQSGYLAGRGRMLVLRREGGKWILKINERIGPEWVS
jgi:hypothetical protein